ncbi:MAG: hypothetical protein J6R68_02290 [Clostridia bacterium]|nr:hypothetical protein [Clostridia bacterium]
MKFLKISLVFIFCFIIGTGSFAREITIDEFNISNIEIPEEFMICTQDTCDEKLKSILTANGFDFTTWVSDVMKPNSYYLYATNSRKDCIYVTCQKNETPDSKIEEDQETPNTNKNYMVQSENNKAKLLKKAKNELVLQWGSADDVSTLAWADFSEDSVTPYLEYVCNIKSQYVHGYETSYNGSKICFQFTSPRKFSEEQKDMHSQIVKNAKLGRKVDYTEAQNIARGNSQNNLNKKAHNGENTKILTYVLSVSIALDVVLAIYIAIKTQSKKRKRTIIANNEDESLKNNNTENN